MGHALRLPPPSPAWCRDVISVVCPTLGCGVSHLLASAVSPRPFRLSAVARAQVLVDSLVVLAPVGLYADLGTLSILGAGTFALFFKGLLELSKSFLDPFGNEGYPGQNIRVEVLVLELNFGAAS